MFFLLLPYFLIRLSLYRDLRKFFRYKRKRLLATNEHQPSKYDKTSLLRKSYLRKSTKKMASLELSARYATFYKPISNSNTSKIGHTL